MGKHTDNGYIVGSCDRTNHYVEEDSTNPYVVQDMGIVLEKSAADRCVSIEFWHDVDDDDSCGEDFIVLAYEGNFNGNNKAVNFLGYGDYYYEYSFSVTLPKNKPLRLVALSFYDNTLGDAGGDCYMEFIIGEDCDW